MVAFLSLRRKVLSFVTAGVAALALAACDATGIGGPLINTSRAVPVALLVPQTSPTAASLAQSLENAARL
ncbi:MAG: penicillin-binding protein activator, partial [Paracoccaceae bacterium]|nr:penicillin-binding protein activator [Paracoccaceae bacterium]